ncbi:MAG: hypothetical protein R2744_08600 [Bacteroidales bacterium]
MKSHLKEKLSFLTILFLLFAAAACTKSNITPEYNPPADHAINKSGHMHKPGLSSPLADCTACHGDDLKGGTTGVSCFECHGTKW